GPLIAKKQIEIAEKVGADAVAHGATGKGNDQVRFELAYYALKPDVTVIAPWREWDFKSREALITFAEQYQIPIAKDKSGEAPFLTDANLLHTSSEGKGLEDPAGEVPGYVYSRSEDPEKAPDRPAYITIDFERGDPVAVDGKKLKAAELLATLNAHGRTHGIGRVDLVENPFVGMKSRGMYETPGGTILLAAHRGIESITLDRGAAHLKDELMPKYAELIYYGFWFAPEREMLQAAIDKSQEFVTGRVRLKLYKGNVGVVGRESKYSLYDQDLVTFEDGTVAYDQHDAEAFTRFTALRLRTLAQRLRKLKLEASFSPRVRGEVQLHLPLDQHALDVGDRFGRVKVLRTGLGAVHDGMAAVQPERIFQIVEPRAGRLVARVHNKALRLQQCCRAEEALRIPPVARTRRGAAGAQDAFVKAVELLPVVVTLLPFLLRGRRDGLQPRLDRSVLGVEIGHVRDQVLHHRHMRQRVDADDAADLAHRLGAGK